MVTEYPSRPEPRPLYESLGSGRLLDEGRCRAAFGDPDDVLAFRRNYADWRVWWAVDLGGRPWLCEMRREMKRARRQRRRARRYGRPADLTWREWLAILVRFSFTCAYCGRRYETLDHVVPLAAGGGTTATNVVPACRPCNERKGEAVWWPAGRVQI